ncbi:MAG: hypothetical protein JW993_02610 [Sedimentisphaerales bacterium]|nr:hypothetical protein [Sedimentisphaerales bacterium]
MTYARRRHLLGVMTVTASLAAGLIVWRLCCPPPLYRVTILPSLGGWDTRAYSLNDRGQIAGVEQIALEEEHLFLWDRENGIRDLGPATGNPITINNAGQISGTMLADANQVEAFLWRPGKGRTRLGTFGDKGSTAFAMNNHGQVIGMSSNPDGSAFLWDKATGMTQLHTPDGPRCQAVSINDAGQVLAMSILQPLGASRWFLLDPNGPISLNATAATVSALSVNGNSCVAGIENPGGPKPYLLFWDKGRSWKRLFPIGVHSPVTRLNDRNQIAYTEFRADPWEEVRDRFSAPPHSSGEYTVSYLWDPVRGRIGLDRYLHGVDRFLVKDLNNKGCIIGTGETKDGRTRSILLEPIPKRWGK